MTSLHRQQWRALLPHWLQLTTWPQGRKIMPTTATVHVRHVLRAFSLAFSSLSCWILVSVSVVVAPTTQGEQKLIHVSTNTTARTHAHKHTLKYTLTHTHTRTLKHACMHLTVSLEFCWLVSCPSRVRDLQLFNNPLDRCTNMRLLATWTRHG